VLLGVEIHADVVEHCKESIERWKQSYPPARKIRHLDIIHGNASQIVSDKGEALLGFDRIYIGASVDESTFPRLKNLLKPGGILVGPGKRYLFLFAIVSSSPFSRFSS
jgi:protein-L-isoaspartate O-methyltransferase